MLTVEKFESRAYAENIFILTQKGDGYKYVFFNDGDISFFPLFYNVVDWNRFIQDMSISEVVDIKKIPVEKAELFLYCPAKPVIFTTVDRRGQKDVKYYGKKYFNHVLLSQKGGDYEKIDAVD